MELTAKEETSVNIDVSSLYGVSYDITKTGKDDT